MRFFRPILIGLLLISLSCSLLAYQGQGMFQQEDGQDFLPRNVRKQAEWIFTRFRYSTGGEGYGRFRRWAADYPKSDHQFVQGVRRLTRIDTQVAEQVVDADNDEIYNWPWIFIEDAGAWNINPQQAARLREYLQRGGFLMFDDTHGAYEWNRMVQGIHMILPDRFIEDLTDQDEIFHVLFDVVDRFQIPGTRYIWGGRRYTPDSRVPKWLGIRDDKGRIIVAICHNSDVGDAWEWADSPNYPEKSTTLAFRLGINYIIYGMTH